MNVKVNDKMLRPITFTGVMNWTNLEDGTIKYIYVETKENDNAKNRLRRPIQSK